MAPVMIGESPGTVAVFRDITRDVEVERMKSEFVANVSHELRTPLTSIKGYADLMAMGVGGSMNEQQSRFVKTIRENTERMAGLVSDLLLISNIDSGKDTLVTEPFSLAEAIESVVGSLSSIPEHAAKQIIITRQVAADLPSLEADRIKIMQAVANVVDNAYSYTPAGGRIEIAAALRGHEHVRITIKDSGIGIPQEFQERVWKRFERNDQTALVMAVAGTGLGLPIARQYVEMHGGRIWFESVPNQGTTFYIDLPLRPEQPRPQESEAEVHTTES
jgi:signal transduction histidine kinase